MSNERQLDPATLPQPQVSYEEHVQLLQHQHAVALDEVIASHLLWLPEIVYPLVTAEGVIHTLVRLNDKRECAVITSALSGQTFVTEWKTTA